MAGGTPANPAALAISPGTSLSRCRGGSLLAAASSFRGRGVVLERHVETYPVLGDLAVFDSQVLPDDLRDAKIAQGLGCGLDGALRCRLPRRAAGPHQLGHSVDAVGHGYLLFTSAESSAIVAQGGAGVRNALGPAVAAQGADRRSCRLVCRGPNRGDRSHAR